MKKKLLSIFLAMAMICTMLSGLTITASAATISVSGTDAFQNAVNNAANNTETTIKLTDYLAPNYQLTIPANKKITLDMNGWYIHSYTDEACFKVSGTLTIKNSSKTLSSIYHNAQHSGKNALIYVLDGGNLTINPGTGTVRLQNNTATAGLGGGIDLRNGTFNMYDKTEIKSCSSVNGGGVCVSGSSTFNMYGGLIDGCTAKGAQTRTGSGGGVFVDDSGKFSMTGGTIQNCTTDRYGGGVENYGTFTMKKATIKNCKATNYYGGGVESEGTVTISESTITGNTAKSYNQLYCTSGTFTISGYCTIDSGMHNVTNNITKSKITFDKQGGTGGSNSVDPATYNSAMPTATMPTKTGYSFNGYFDAKSGGTKYYNANGTSAKNWDKIVASTTLYAQWTANTYNVTLYANDGTCSELTSYTYGIGATLPIPTKTGYTFGGWYADDNFSGNAVTAISATETGDKVFYAKWTVNGYTVTLKNVEDAECETLSSYTYGEGATLPIPTKNLYRFEGWYDNEDFNGDPVTEITATDTGDKEFFAKWEMDTVIAESENTVDFPSVQSKITGDTAVMRFMWQINYTQDTEINNIGAYIIPWGMFDSITESGSIVKYVSPIIQSGDTFSADLTDIPRTAKGHDIFSEMKFSAYPFINDKILSDAYITSTVKGSDIDGNGGNENE